VSCVSSLLPVFCNSQTMPCPSRCSNIAKLKRQTAHTGFGNHSRHASGWASSESEYCVSDNHSDKSIVYLGSSANREEIDNESEEEVEAAVGTLQSLYSVFLPPHLCNEAKTQEKRCRIDNRPPMYAGNSWVTCWQKNTAHRNAAKGCATLNTFVMRKVCSYS
jgi:hypothetical protein